MIGGVTTQTGIRARLGAALRLALRARDTLSAAALRSALAAIGNAEAISPPSGPGAAGSRHVAGAAVGLGAGEAERRYLTEAEVGDIVQAEITERQDAASQYERAGQGDRAERLRREAGVLVAVLGSAARPAGRPRTGGPGRADPDGRTRAGGP
jgi:uncharacterized protein YqeY